jgi:alkylhydroperoxidase/carboxymuconolactone decarboxylase family protein YurZ
MKLIAMTLASLSLFASSTAQATEARDNVRAVAPALEKYKQSTLFGDLWKRPGLNPRDRSIVTLAALITRNQTAEMSDYLNLALDNGVAKLPFDWSRAFSSSTRCPTRTIQPTSRCSRSTATGTPTSRI